MATAMPNPKQNKLPVNLILLAIVLFAMGIYAYSSLRFRGQWNENDTMVLTRAIYFANDGSTILESERTYGNGLSYQAVVVLLMQVTGISLQDLQAYILPLLTAVLPLVAFVAYRAFTKSNIIALLGTFMLFLQPDFLFVTWRGSHERVTWLFSLMSLYFIAKSFDLQARGKSYYQYMFLFYIMIFALACSNAFFATSYTTALLLSFLTGSIFLVLRYQWHRKPDETTRFFLSRIFFAMTASLILIYLFFFYIYPPALELLKAFRTLVDGLAALFLTTSDNSANAYDYVASAWISSRVFLILTAYSWLTLLISFIVWTGGAIYFIRRKEIDYSKFGMLFLWMIYPAFGAQLAGAVVADRVGALGSNLQVRLFAPVVITAIPMAAIGVHIFIQRLQPKPVRQFVLAAAGFTAAFICIASLLKTTNDPIVSNNWTFNIRSERIAAEWLLDNSSEPTMWGGIDGRIQTAVVFAHPEISPVFFRGGINIPNQVRYYVLSELERARWIRQGITLPYLSEEFIIYDNGLTQIYYRQPRTIYQW